MLESASAWAGSPAIASAAVAADALMKSLLFIPAIASPPDYSYDQVMLSACLGSPKQFPQG
jgi:hypothetical protein